MADIGRVPVRHLAGVAIRAEILSLTALVSELLRQNCIPLSDCI